MRLRRFGAVLGALSLAGPLVLAGCSPAPGTGAQAGTTVNISGSFTGQQAIALQADLDAWSKDKGFTVKFTGNPNFSSTIGTQVKGGQAPDIALFPQPGVLKSLINEGTVPMDDLVDVAAVTADETTGVPDLGKANGKTWGLFITLNVKSLVWYNPSAFKANGYTVPTTDEELMALQNKIIQDGAGYPWCAGIKVEGANGWPMTDWVEEYVLRYGGIDQYNDWISHTISFDSALVRKAMGKIESVLFAPGSVEGGRKAVASQSFDQVGNNLFVTGGKQAGQCFMMRMPAFITGSFPKDIQAQLTKGDTSNVNAFPLPTPSDAAVKSAVLGGGLMAAAFNTKDATKQVVNYIVSKEFGANGYFAGWPGNLSPHKDFVDKSAYTSVATKVSDAALSNAEAFGFDGSDQMPAAIGGGGAIFHTNVVQWTAEQASTDEAVKAIDAGWPQ